MWDKEREWLTTIMLNGALWKLWEHNHQKQLPRKMISSYPSWIASSTKKIILFQIFFCEEKLSIVWNTLKYFIVEMKSQKLNNYSTKNLQFNYVSYGLKLDPLLITNGAQVP